MSASMLSVGIDIGTTTTQVIFSRLEMENVASYFSVPRVEIVRKEVVYKGEIHFTPLLSQTLIDGDGVRAIIEAEFRRAGFSPRDTDSGAVIITGEAARKENASVVLDLMSGMAGDFVVSTAGPDLESVMAGKGSGAQRYSADSGRLVVNLDIGGGTTNIAVFDAGDTIGVGCLDIGGRLIRFDSSGRVDYVSPRVELVFAEAGVRIEAGQRADETAVAKVAAIMNRVLEEALGLAPPSPLLGLLQTSGGSTLLLERPVEAVSFSGGVAECVYNPEKETFRYRDMGVLLGRAIVAGRLVRTGRLFKPAETIRATVIGAGTYATTVSGSTITFTTDVFPQKNLPVLSLAKAIEDAVFRGEHADLAREAAWFLGQHDGRQLVLAMRGKENPSYAELTAAAGGIVRALDGLLPPEAPVLVSLEHDIAKALGQCMDTILAGARRVVCIDGVRLCNGDFLDMGAPLMGGVVIPVVVKTLVFG